MKNFFREGSFFQVGRIRENTKYFIFGPDIWCGNDPKFSDKQV